VLALVEAVAREHLCSMQLTPSGSTTMWKLRTCVLLLERPSRPLLPERLDEALENVGPLRE
jgi:hypothetical protein